MKGFAMTAKDIANQVFSRKASIAAVGIVALCYIATITSGQVTIDQANVSVMPMSPALPAADSPVDWKIPVMITVIACLAIVAQAILDYFRPRHKKIIDIDISKIKPPSTESLN